MVGVYFSGTGNTKFCVEKFLDYYDNSQDIISIEDDKSIDKIKSNTDIILAYSIHYSNIPKIVRNFIKENSSIFAGKNIFIIATMGLFSGDGTGCSARLLKKYGANIVGGLHLKMPDSIGDEKVLKRPLGKNKQLVKSAEEKIKMSAKALKNQNPTQEGLGFLYHFAGLFGQRLWFYNKTKNYSNKLKINKDRCIGCEKCAKLCPMNNLYMDSQKSVSRGKCAMCYRCINNCPTQAITLLGKEVIEQCKIEKYLE